MNKPLGFTDVAQLKSGFVWVEPDSAAPEAPAPQADVAPQSGGALAPAVRPQQAGPSRGEEAPPRFAPATQAMQSGYIWVDTESGTSQKVSPPPGDSREC